MKILLVANYLADNQKSMFAFSEMLEHELKIQGHTVVTIRPSNVLLPLNRSPKGFYKWIAYIDKFLIFPLKLKFLVKSFDVVHICDHSNAIYVNSILTRPNIITCHDVIAIQAAIGEIPGWEVGFFGKILQKLIKNGLSKAQKIVCVSNLTFRDLIRLSISAPKHVVIVNNGLNAKFSPLNFQKYISTLQSIGLSSEDKYFIHVGSDLDRKNRFAVLRSFFEIISFEGKYNLKNGGKLKLIFVGPKLNEVMHEYARENKLLDRVVVVKNVSHNELCALYSGAVGMIFPSINEGFGWPVIEAQACGCPVFASNLAPMNEIGGDAAIYFDPFNVKDIAKKIELSHSKIYEMRTAGILNSNLYSSKNMISNYVAAYESCIKSFSNVENI